MMALGSHEADEADEADEAGRCQGEFMAAGIRGRSMFFSLLLRWDLKPIWMRVPTGPLMR
jgi:hypothetical protein